jgi:filamentous hemagglutinin family protein
MQRAFNSFFFSTLPLVSLGCLISLTAQAQVTPDGTTSTTVTQDGNNFTINQGNRVGDNLFHSFSEFSVPTLGSAVFNNAADIANIFSRVTGSSISNIDGLIGANGAANLFLINPNGIIFGQNASLNLGGSFFASTADSLLFDGNTEFSAVNPQAPPLLEVSIPIGARFRDNPGDITVKNSSLFSNITSFSPTDNYFAFIGGNVTFDEANFLIPGLRVELGGLTEAGTIDIIEDGSLRFPDAVARGNVSVINSSLINVSGAGGGSININANNFELTSGSRFNVGIFAGLGSPDAQAGDVVINATNNVSIDGANSSIFSNSGINDLGNLGNIEITAQNINFTNGGSIVISCRVN